MITIRPATPAARLSLIRRYRTSFKSELVFTLALLIRPDTAAGAPLYRVSGVNSTLNLSDTPETLLNRSVSFIFPFQ